MKDMTIESTAQVQQDIVDAFAMLGDWRERYQYLIELGQRLPPLLEAFKSDPYRVQGCQSMVWLVSSGNADCLHFEAASDSAIVSGLLWLLLQVYSDRSATEIIATEPWFIQASGLVKHLSPTRSNGLATTLAKLRACAAATIQA